MYSGRKNTPPIQSPMAELRMSMSTSHDEADELGIDDEDGNFDLDNTLNELDLESNSKDLSKSILTLKNLVQSEEAKIHSLLHTVTYSRARSDPENSFRRLIITNDLEEQPKLELLEDIEPIIEAINLRRKYLYTPKHHWPRNASPSEKCPFDPFTKDILGPSHHQFKMVEGVFRIYDNQESLEKDEASIMIKTNISEFYRDLTNLMKWSSFGPCKTLCFRRLRLLEAKYNLHMLLNDGEELACQKLVPHRDFYNVRKVDTHVHHSSSMNQKHLLRFIKHKLNQNPDEVVIFRDDKYLTLSQVFESLNLTAYDLSVDTLDVHAGKNTFHRFDKFNLKYNPCGQSRLREIFLKTDNLIQGKYLAELTKELFSDLKFSKYQHAEYRLSIYGRKYSEWDTLAAWIVDNELYCDNVRWLIQIPRLYDVYRESETGITTFSEFLCNIFGPLFEVTKNPSSHPKLYQFLQQVVGFDSVDDESKPERKFHEKYPTPDKWTSKYNPPYTYYIYYLYANLHTLNQFREEKNMNTFTLRPHSGEAGEFDHLGAAFMLAHNVNHGINLRKVPVLQYLFYLCQIGLAMSPLSNNCLFLTYDKNPFPIFFARGLNVSLSTDDPLQFHYTKEPLMEEYSIATQVWHFTPADICEIARNSVLQSGFEHPIKSWWLGPDYLLPGAVGNDIRKTNVPNIRICFRQETLAEELYMLYKVVVNSKKPIDLHFLTSQLPAEFLTSVTPTPEKKQSHFEQKGKTNERNENEQNNTNNNHTTIAVSQQ